METPPPSYESVMAHLDSQVSKEFCVGDVEKVASTLTDEQLKVLLAHQEPVSLDMLDMKTGSEDEKRFINGLAAAAVHPETDDLMQAQVNQAAESVQKIHVVFRELTVGVAEMDAKFLEPGAASFSSRLLDIKQTFDKHISAAAAMATDISSYAERFATILPVVQDQSIPLPERQALIDGYIQKSQAVSEQAGTVVATFTKINQDMVLFVADFGKWAWSKEQAEREEVTRLNAEISELGNKLSKLKTAQLALGLVAGLSLPIAGTAAVIFPVAAPFIIIGGLLVAGLSAAAVVGLTIAINATESDIRNKEAERGRKLKDADELKALREKMESMGRTQVANFGAAIGDLSTVWQTCRNDAQQISNWLGDLKGDLQIPPLLKADMEKILKAYSNMAKYLKTFADGVQRQPAAEA